MLGEEETIEERIAHFNLEIKKPFLTEPIQELDRAFNWKILFSLHLMYSINVTYTFTSTECFNKIKVLLEFYGTHFQNGN